MSAPQGGNNLGTLLVVGLLLLLVFGSQKKDTDTPPVPQPKLLKILLQVLARQIDFDGRQDEPRLQFLSDVGQLLREIAKRALLGQVITGKERATVEKLAEDLDSLNGDSQHSTTLDVPTRKRVVGLLQKYAGQIGD